LHQVRWTEQILTVLAGWIVTYIIDERHGGPKSGYISSGFFGGKYPLPVDRNLTLNSSLRSDTRPSRTPTNQ
jgi:hypothetical protein